MYPANTLIAECYFLSSTAGQTSRVLLADVIPWIKLIKLALCYTCILHASCIVPCHNWSEARKLYCTIEFVSCDWSIETCHCMSRSRVGLRLHLCDWGTGVDVACRLCMHYIYWWPFTLCIIRTMQLLGMWSSVALWAVCGTSLFPEFEVNWCENLCVICYLVVSQIESSL